MKKFDGIDLIDFGCTFWLLAIFLSTGIGFIALAILLIKAIV